MFDRLITTKITKIHVAYKDDKNFINNFRLRTFTVLFDAVYPFTAKEKEKRPRKVSFFSLLFVSYNDPYILLKYLP